MQPLLSAGSTTQIFRRRTRLQHKSNKENQNMSVIKINKDNFQQEVL